MPRNMFVRVEGAMLGVNHQPVNPQRYRQVGDGRRFEGDPQAVDRLTTRQFFPERLQSPDIHRLVPIVAYCKIANTVASGEWNPVAGAGIR